MGLIFYLSSLQGYTLPMLVQNSDKIVHTIFYIPLAFLLYFALKHSGVKKNVFLLTVALTILYGISDEYHQRYVPNRISSAGDVIADSLGAFLGSFLAGKVSSKKN